MENQITRTLFLLTGSSQRESEDLSLMLFKDINFKKIKQKISFFRSDFRQSHFINTHFYFNNFDRADFISCVFENCKLERCNIASSEIKNCYFFNVEFSANQYDNTSIQDCIFEDCSFPDENFLVNMKSCKFINCIFSNCNFERSTTELLEFQNCKLINTNLATMHAERHQFSHCELKNVEIDLSYFFSYLVSNTSMDEIEFLYRGHSVDLKSGTILTDSFDKLVRENRYYELINGHIQFAEYEKLVLNIDLILDKVSQMDSFLRIAEFKNIFRAFQFYLLQNMLPYDVFIKFIEIIKNYNWNQFPFEEKLEYLAETQKLECIIDVLIFQEPMISSANAKIALLTFKCKTDDYNEAYSTVSNFLSYTFKKLHVDFDFELIKKEQGSWILSFAMVASAALITVNVIKSILSIPVHIQKNNEEISRSKIRLKEEIDQSIVRLQIIEKIQNMVGEDTPSYKNLKQAKELVNYSELNYKIAESSETNALQQLIEVIKISS